MWNSLLVIYAALIIPTVFSILVGMNILVWARNRINYPFIFELELRTVIDSREYLEVRIKLWTHFLMIRSLF